MRSEASSAEPGRAATPLQGPARPREPLFHECYDRLFASKNYADEVRSALAIARSALGHEPTRILEIGCGTGNHTLELARAGAQVLAVDIDPLMAIRARAKLLGHPSLRARVLHSRVESLEDSGFDLACALFHVVTYLRSDAELESFFASVRQRLVSGGVFLFDFWNGVAAFRDPPGEKRFEWSGDEETVRCQLTSETDFMAQVTRLSYEIELTRTDETGARRETHRLDQTLWTPMQIRSALSRSGLQELFCAPSSDPSRAATESDWKILFGARAA